MAITVYLLLGLVFLIWNENLLCAEGLIHPTPEKSLSSIAIDRRSFSVMTMAFLPNVASAYERRDVGDGNRSATTAAFNDAAFETNNRLEASGFKLDTREEEQARLSQAMASFSYEAAAPKKKPGYGSSSATTGAASKATQK